jgi:hypothetical protein
MTTETRIKTNGKRMDANERMTGVKIIQKAPLQRDKFKMTLIVVVILTKVRIVSCLMDKADPDFHQDDVFSNLVI